MATLIGDYASEPSRFHTMIATPGLQYNHNHNHNHNQQHPEPPHYRSTSRSREAPSRQQSSSSPSSRTQTQTQTQRPAQTPPSSSASASASTSRYTSTTPQAHSSRGSAAAAGPADKHATSSSGGASRFPSPPDSSSPSGSAASASRSEENLVRSSQHGSRSAYMDSTAHDFAQEASSSVSTQSTVIAPSSTTSRGPQAIPSPSSDSGAAWSASHDNDLSSSSPPPQTQTTIRVRDLAHIQSLARADLLSGNGPGILNDPPLQAMKYEISGMPISDIIEMVAALLTKITTTNDLQHDALNRNANHVKQAQAQNEGSAGENHMSPMSSSVLAFHGKNVPAITILSYLSRIHKYCPTTYEVFLSLLVYFDRMTERVNDIVMKAEEARRSGQAAAGPEQPQTDVVMRDEGSHGEDETDEDLADDSDDEDMDRASKTGHESRDNGATAPEAARSTSAPINQQATFFVVDSFNIHRLIIAGVTCASKFFSDVFYTNSRYAKVGGLPLAELNHLELQFLLLNDFRLAVPVEDLEAYATMLVEFYAREVVAQRSRPVVSMD